MTKAGMREFTEEALEANLKAILKAVSSKRPESIKGKQTVKTLGRYFKAAIISTTAGPGVKVDLSEYS